MKLKLPKHLLLSLLLSCSSIPSIAFSGEVDVTDESIRQEYTNDTTVISSNPSLTYDGWICNDPFIRDHYKGAIFNASGNLSFQGDFALTITNSSMGTFGGFIASSQTLSFDGLTKLSLKNNKVEQSNGISSSYFGLLYAQHGMIFTNMEEVEIIDNTNTSGPNGGYASLIHSTTSGNIRFDSIRKINISNNITSEGGRYGHIIQLMKGDLLFSNIEELTMNNNCGTVLRSYQSVQMENLGAILFKDNKGSSYGGVVDMLTMYTTDTVSFVIENCGKVEFLNNSAEDGGGALMLQSVRGQELPDVFLSADQGDIIFKGNHVRGLFNRPSVNPYLNAILFLQQWDGESEKTHLNLRAQKGRSIVFYDPVTSFEFQAANEKHKIVISFNEAAAGSDVAYTGIIRFDGSEVEKTIIKDSGVSETDEEYQQRLDDSRYSYILGDATLYGGSLILTHKVIFGRKLEDITPGVETSFTLAKGILEVTNESQLHAFNVSFSDLDAVLRMDNSSHIQAINVTATNGLSFDVDYWLKNANANVVIKASNASFSGVIGMQDGMDTYSDNQWANTLTFKLIDASDITNLDDQLSGIQSNISGSSVIDDPYQYKGEWSYKWVGTQLVAKWTPVGGIIDVNPELEGNIISNSMWCSASNVKSLSNTALANANILRMESSLGSNFWVKGIGDFAYDDSSAELDGYSYQGGGYAAGADFKLGAKSIVGVAFGQLMGDNKSELYTAKIKQESMMGTLYAAHLQTLNKRNSLLWTLAGTYGRTDNSMNTHYSDGQNSAGSWNNNAYFVEAKMEWRISPEGKNWTYKPFIGLEYTDVSLDSFTETGDKARSFGDGKYKNLALPIGMGVEHQSRFGTKTWLNSLSLAYVPDAYREAPSTQATRLSNGFSWKDQGSKPSIHTLRASINSTLQLNAAWTAYLGYTFEAREGANYHNVNTGVSYSF